MKKPSKLLFIYLLSFFSLCFTPNALGGQGKGGWFKLGNCFGCASFDKEELMEDDDAAADSTSDAEECEGENGTGTAAEDATSDAEECEGEIGAGDGAAAAADTHNDFEDYSMEDLAYGKEYNYTKLSLLLAKKRDFENWVTVVEKRVGEFDTGQSIMILFVITECVAGTIPNDNIIAIIDNYLKKLRAQQEHYSPFEIYQMLCIFTTSPILKKRADRIWPDSINDLINRAPKTIKQYDYNCFTKTIMMLAILGANVHQNPEFIALIDTWLNLPWCTSSNTILMASILRKNINRYQLLLDKLYECIDRLSQMTKNEVYYNVASKSIQIKIILGLLMLKTKIKLKADPIIHRIADHLLKKQSNFPCIIIVGTAVVAWILERTIEESILTDQLAEAYSRYNSTGEFDEEYILLALRSMTSDKNLESAIDNPAFVSALDFMMKAGERDTAQKIRNIMVEASSRLLVEDNSMEAIELYIKTVESILADNSHTAPSTRTRPRARRNELVVVAGQQDATAQVWRRRREHAADDAAVGDEVAVAANQAHLTLEDFITAMPAYRIVFRGESAGLWAPAFF